MLKKLLLAIAACGLAFGACAADGAAGVSGNAEKLVRQAVLRLAPRAQVDSIKPAGMPGFYQVIASGRMVYVSADGKYMFNGDLIDLASRSNLSDVAWAAFRKAELAKVPESQRIVFAPANPKYRVTVFTDVNCGYCRALHQHIAEFNKDGIAVEYLAWPREGVTTTAGNLTPTYKEMVSVWCAADRKAAFTAAKNGRLPKSASCANPVKDEFDLGVKLGVSGTPTIIGQNGMVLGGYLAPDQLLKMLQKGEGG